MEKTEPSKGRVVWRHPLGGWRSGWGGLRALVFGLRSDNGEPDVRPWQRQELVNHQAGRESKEREGEA